MPDALPETMVWPKCDTARELWTQWRKLGRNFAMQLMESGGKLWDLLTKQLFLCTTSTTRHRASTSTRWHFAFGLCCHSNETRAPIANLPNRAQLGRTIYHSPNLHPGPCSNVACGDGQTHRQTDRHTDARDHYTFGVVCDSREM